MKVQCGKFVFKNSQEARSTAFLVFGPLSDKASLINDGTRWQLASSKEHLLISVDFYTLLVRILVTRHFIITLSFHYLHKSPLKGIIMNKTYVVSYSKQKIAKHLIFSFLQNSHPSQNQLVLFNSFFFA